MEITSRFAGVVKKLYYDAGEMAKVGRPFIDIDIQGEPKQEALDALTPAEPPEAPESTAQPPSAAAAAPTCGSSVSAGFASVSWPRRASFRASLSRVGNHFLAPNEPNHPSVKAGSVDDGDVAYGSQ